MAEETKAEVKARKSAKKEYVFAVGRRREAVARVRLYSGKDSVMWGELEAKKGEILVNGKKIEEYFSGDVAKAIYQEPLRVTNTLNKAIVSVRVVGGGLNGQLGAFVQGISRALDKLDSKTFRPILKKRGFLTRDARVRQRRSVGMGGKSRRSKQSPKR